MPSGKHATGHTRKSGQLRYRTDAGKPRCSACRATAIIWSGSVPRKPVLYMSPNFMSATYRGDFRGGRNR